MRSLTPMIRLMSWSITMMRDLLVAAQLAEQVRSSAVSLSFSPAAGSSSSRTRAGRPARARSRRGAGSRTGRLETTVRLELAELQPLQQRVDALACRAPRRAASAFSPTVTFSRTVRSANSRGFWNVRASPARARRARRGSRDRAAVEGDLAPRRSSRTPGDAVDERRLARPVRPDQPEHLALRELEVDPRQRRHAAEALDDRGGDREHATEAPSPYSGPRARLRPTCLELAVLQAVDRDVPDRVAVLPAHERAAGDLDVGLGPDRVGRGRGVGHVLLLERLRRSPSSPGRSPGRWPARGSCRTCPRSPREGGRCPDRSSGPGPRPRSRPGRSSRCRCEPAVADELRQLARLQRHVAEHGRVDAGGAQLLHERSRSAGRSSAR